MGTASISGRVTSADSGAPIFQAQVTVGGAGSQRPVTVVTDREGRFIVRNLPAGTYTVVAYGGQYRAAYLQGGYGVAYMDAGAGAGPAVRPKPIELADGEQRTNITIALVRGAAVVGTVFDSTGEAVSGIQVGVMRVRRGAEPVPMRTVTSDDLGQFRLHGLAPGEYIVFGDMRGGFGGGREVQSPLYGYATTYAPGTLNLNEAQRVKVGRGGQITVDLRLSETRVFSVKGRILTSTGEAPKNASVTISRSGPASAYGGYGGGVNADGTFVLNNVAPGEYELTARHSLGERGPLSAADTEMVTVRLDVGNADVEDVMLVTRRGSIVSGEIVFDELPPSENRRASIHAQFFARRSFSPPPAVEIKDRTFTLNGVFHPLILRGGVVPTPGSTEAWGLKAVLLDGRDITDEPRLFTENDSGKLQVVFTLRAPAVEGTVTDDAGKVVQDAWIVLFGEDAATWTAGSSRLRQTRPQSEGRFKLPALREGRYRIVAVAPSFFLNQAAPDVELLEALSKVATPLVLNAGETRTIDLRLTPFERQHPAP